MDLQSRIDAQDKLIQELKDSIISFTNMHNYNMSILQNYVTVLQNYITSNDNNIHILEDRIKMLQGPVAPNPMSELDKLCNEAALTVIKQAKIAKATKKSTIINKLHP